MFLEIAVKFGLCKGMPPFKICQKFVDTPPDIQVVPTEINVRKQNWLILPFYSPPQQNSEYFVEEISILMDKCTRYDHVMVLGDFNLEPDHIALSSVIQDHDLTWLSNQRV